MWFEKMFVESYNVFYKYPVEKRRHLVSSYDFAVKTVSQGKLILQHQGIPYQLCDNGNLWLSLSSVTVSTQKRSGNATITNTQTGEHYVFIDGRYVLSEALAITQDELLILELMCNDLSMDRIMSQLKIPKSSFMRKKQQLFSKLDVKNAAGAVYKAGLMGII